MQDFDKQFKRTNTMIFVMWAITSVISLAFFGGIIWVAWHFISKVW